MKFLNPSKLTSKSAMVWLGATALGLSALLYAQTPANTVITNLASVDYEDENGNPFTATSNEAEVTVGSVFSATIQADALSVDGAPGQTVYIPYQITNTGNDVDTYTLTFVNEAGDGAEGASPGANIDGTNLEVFLETTVNGQPDAGEAVVTEVTVAPGETAFLAAAVTIPSASNALEEIGVVLTATSTNVTVDDITPDPGNFAGQGAADQPGNGEDDLEETVQGLIIITTGPVLVPTKSSTLDINAGANGQITYTLTLTNNGGDATNVDIFEAIPANTTFTASSLVLNGLLDRAGTASDDLQLDQTVGATGTFETISASGFGANNIGTLFDEPTLFDLDGDGIPGESNVSGFLLRDVSLENGNTISIEYVVDLAPGLAAGTDIANIFCVGVDIQGGTTSINDATCSNQVIDEVPQVFAVDADDTDGDGDATPGDGTDDPGSTATEGDDEDGFDDDTQFEQSAAVGETVALRNVITNNGNGPDNFNLEIDTSTSTFPAGTIFTFFDGTNAVPLTDDSGDGIADTGTIAAGASIEITVRAQLPAVIGALAQDGSTAITFANNQFFIDVAAAGNTAGVFDGGNGSDNDFATTADNERFAATLTATSVGSLNNANVLTAFDTKIDSLGVITAAGVDIASATLIGNTDGGVADIVSSPADIALVAVGGNITLVDTTEDAGDDVVANLFNAAANVQGDDEAAGIGAANDAGDFTANYAVAVGEVFTVDLVAANEAGSPDAFLLGVANFETTVANSTQAISGFAPGVPTGWSIRFLDDDGSEITSTPSIPGGSVYHYTAEITVSADGNQALDGTDYFLAFSVNSAANPVANPFVSVAGGVADVRVDRVQIDPFCAISIIPNGSEQIQPGGTEDFEHTLANDGNSARSFDLSSFVETNDGGADDDSFTSTIFVDSDGDSQPDISLAQALATATDICFFNAASALVCTLTPTAGGAGIVTPGTEAAIANIVLQPGEQILLWNRVFAPADAANGAVQTSTIQAFENTVGNGCSSSLIFATDTATVIFGQVRLDKSVAVDTDCDCDASGLTFAEVATTTVNPGQCVIWRLTAINEGSADASNVVINDAITEFSVLASDGVFGADNVSGNTTAPIAGTDPVLSVCESANNGGAPVDCTLVANQAVQTPAAGDDETDLVGDNVTFRVGFGADNTAGGLLIPGDQAVAQFCIQVE